MRLNQIPTPWNLHVEKLRGKWIDFTNGIVGAIANELLNIRREEAKDRLRAHHQREQSREPSQQ